MAKEMNRSKKGYVAMKSFFALIYVRIGKQICAGGFVQATRSWQTASDTHSMDWTYMCRAHVQANIWHHDMILKLTCLDPLTMRVEILRPNTSTGSFSLGCTSSGLSAVRCNYGESKCSRRLSCRGNNLVCTKLCKCGKECATVRTLHNQWLANI